ncbi:hypothetical protein AB0B28_12435 [Glycomyces sp. NPDC046736]|uniref:hypothetical protein n=1 Tax=Glycomyces sp. NPDC046736 TaxID=3155615 RepID=UPI0034106382
MNIVIVRYGMAGAQKLGRRAVEVTVSGREREAAYHRIFLSRVISAKQSEAEIALPKPGPDPMVGRVQLFDTRVFGGVRTLEAFSEFIRAATGVVGSCTWLNSGVAGVCRTAGCVGGALMNEVSA